MIFFFVKFHVNTLFINYKLCGEEGGIMTSYLHFA